jgi:hypothetical protein
MPLVAKRLSRKTMLIAGLAAYIARFAVFAYLPYPAAVIPAVAYGYEENGKRFLVRGYFGPEPQWMSPDRFGAMRTFLMEHAAPPARGQLVAEALQQAVDHWQRGAVYLPWKHGHYWYGEQAFDVWIEDLGGDRKALRVGQADGSQTGRYTITLRASTHGWAPVDLGTSHEVSVRFCARYSGAAFLGVSVPGGGAIVDIGGGMLKVRQRLNGEDQTTDETVAAQTALSGKWSAAGPARSSSLQWTATAPRTAITSS